MSNQRKTVQILLRLNPKDPQHSRFLYWLSTRGSATYTEAIVSAICESLDSQQAKLGMEEIKQVVRDTIVSSLPSALSTCMGKFACTSVPILTPVATIPALPSNKPEPSSQASLHKAKNFMSSFGFK